MEVINNTIKFNSDSLSTASRKEDNVKSSDDFNKVMKNVSDSKDTKKADNNQNENQSNVKTAYANDNAANKVSKDKITDEKDEISFKDESDAKEKINNMDTNSLLLLLSQLLNEIKSGTNVKNDELNSKTSVDKVSNVNVNDLLKMIKDKLNSLALSSESGKDYKETLNLFAENTNSNSGNKDLNQLSKSIDNDTAELNSLLKLLNSNGLKSDNTNYSDLQKHIEALSNDFSNVNQGKQLNDGLKNKIVSDITSLMQDLQANKDANSLIGEKLQNILENSLTIVQNQDNKKSKSSLLELYKQDTNLNKSNFVSVKNSVNKDASLSEANQNYTEAKGKNHSSDADSKNSSLSSDDSESNLLKSLTGDNKDNKFSKVTNFMTQFNEVLGNSDIKEAGKAVVINRNSFTADVVKNIKYMEINDIKDLTVKIVPKELGEVIIKLTMDGNVMKANITATNKEAYNIINSNLQEISNKLSDENMKIQSFSVNVSNGSMDFMNNGTNGGNDQNGQGRSGKNRFEFKDEDLEVKSADVNEGNVNILV